MTKAEIAAFVDGFSEEERTYAKAYIKMKELVSDPEYREEASRRLKEMKAGKGVSSEQFLELNSKLNDCGL